MPDTVTSLLQLLLMGDGSHPNDWGSQSNINWQKVEAAAAGATTLTLSGTSRTLTDDEARSAILVLNGTLTSDFTINMPAGRVRKWLLVNNTTAHNVIVQVTGGAGTSYTSAPASGAQSIFSDGTNVSLYPVPVSRSGFVEMFAGATLPANYLWCGGQAVSRTTYASLFAAIGTAHGAGDGSTTFNVPDMRGRVPMGADNIGGTAANRITSLSNALGTAGGEEKHALTTGELASHSHGVTDPGHDHGVTDPSHDHTYTHNVNTLILTGTVGISAPVSSVSATTSSSTTGVSVDSNTTGISIGNTGSGTAHNNLQPLLTTNFVIHI